MRSLVPSLFVLASLSVPAGAQQRSYFALPVQEHVFENGLRLLVMERPGDPRVAAKIFTDFGALVEEPGSLGAAHFLEHLMFKGTTSLGTTDWEAERPLIMAIRETESALVEELNRARNELRERGVFHDRAHARTTPRADSLQAEIARLDRAAAQYRDNGAMMRWYQWAGGGKLTATTEQEYMKFDINLPAPRVELFLRIEADRMKHTVFREFDEERMILVEQRLGDLNRPSTPFYEQLNAAVGIIHPVFWPEGYASDFPQYTRAYERNLYERYFVPNNTTIVLIGGVQFDRMVELVEEYFGWMERAPEPRRALAVEPVPAAERRITYRSDDLEPRVDVRYLIPGVGHPDRPVVDVMAQVATRAIRAELHERGIPGSVDVNTRVVHTSRFGVPGSINFEVVVGDMSRLAGAESAVLDVLERIKAGSVTSEQLERSQKQLRNEWFRTLLDADRLAFEIGHFQTMDSWKTLEPYLEARDRTTEDDLARVASKYFVPENRTTGIVRPPETEGPNVTEGGR